MNEEPSYRGAGCALFVVFILPFLLWLGEPDLHDALLDLVRMVAER